MSRFDMDEPKLTAQDDERETVKCRRKRNASVSEAEDDFALR